MTSSKQIFFPIYLIIRSQCYLKSYNNGLLLYENDRGVKKEYYLQTG